jgi:hypothetical protein
MNAVATADNALQCRLMWRSACHFRAERTLLFDRSSRRHSGERPRICMEGSSGTAFAKAEFGG